MRHTLITKNRKFYRKKLLATSGTYLFPLQSFLVNNFVSWQQIYQTFINNECKWRQYEVRLVTLLFQKYKIFNSTTKYQTWKWKSIIVRSYSTVLRVLSFEKMNSFLKIIIFMKVFSWKPDKAVVKILRSDFEMERSHKDVWCQES